MSAAHRDGLTLLSILLIAALAFQLAHEVAYSHTVFGTARAPASDAYDPWLRGALTYLFFGEPDSNLYRPTIGILFGSIISFGGRIDAVPAFFAVLLCLFLLLAIAKADADLKPALVAWLAYAVIEFGIALKDLNFGNLMPDPPAFAFTLIGASCVLKAMRSRPLDGRWLAMGFLALGIAATIRGPMMLAAPAILLFLAGLARDARSIRALLLAAALFLVPLCADIVQQRLHHVVNNGVATMFCFYTDPSYSWTTPCHNLYLSLKPAASTVVEHYLRTLASHGYDIVVGNLNARLYQEGLLMRTAGFGISAAALALYLGLSAAWTAALATRGHTIAGCLGAALQARYFFVVRLTVLAGAAAYALRLPHESFVAVLSIAVALVCVVFRLARPFVCLAAYWLSAVFLALMTQAHQNRLGFTFSFLLYLALFLAVSERRAVQVTLPNARAPRIVAAGYFLIIAFLYLGVFLYPSEWKRVYRQDIDGKNAALKISEERESNQCLYFTGQRRLAYTACRPN